MTMYKTITENDFINKFEAIRPDNFTVNGLRALFHWFEELEQDMGESIEYDVIGVCCEFSEYANIGDFQDQYSEDYQTIESIEEQTIVIPVGDTAFIIQSF